MRTEFYEETVLQRKERFIADDGTVFDSEGDCIAYEDRRKLDDMPYPQVISVPVPLEEYNVNIALLKSPLDFKKLRTQYEDCQVCWDVYDMEQPTSYPCLYPYYEDSARMRVWATIDSAARLIEQYANVARNLSTWCAQQLETICNEGGIAL